MSFSFSLQPEVLHSKKTGREYALVRADSYPLDHSSIQDVQSLCNQTEIYHSLFQPSLKGASYSEEDAKFFVNHILDGWQQKKHFNWLLTHDERIVGTIGIKSLNGEIGYWVSNQHPGVMSPAVKKLCELAKKAGLQTLWAQVRSDNKPSLKVLSNGGFALKSYENEILRFERILASTDARLELKKNHPVDYQLVKYFYEDPEDLAKAWPEAKSPFYQEEWERWMNAGSPGVSLIFRAGEIPVGHLVLKINEQNQLYLCFVVLKKSHRGRGYIHEMLTMTDAYVLQSFPHECLYLHVEPSNLNALAAYEKHGFEHIGVTEKHRFRMRKEIRRTLIV